MNNWLVVTEPLWKMMEFVNGKDDIPYIMDHKKCLKPPTRQNMKNTFMENRYGKHTPAMLGEQYHAPSTSHVWGCCITNFPYQDLDVYVCIYIYIYIYFSMSIFIIIYSMISPWYPHDIPMISPWSHGPMAAAMAMIRRPGTRWSLPWRRAASAGAAWCDSAPRGGCRRPAPPDPTPAGWGPRSIAKLVYNSNNYGLWYANNYSYWGL